MFLNGGELSSSCGSYGDQCRLVRTELNAGTKLKKGYTMFNVWLPATLESRAKGEGDEAIRSALTEYVLYSGKSTEIVYVLCLS